MEISIVREAVLTVLNEIQTTLGHPCPEINGDDIPSDVLEAFKSPLWPLATTRIAKALDVTIPNDVHIFGGDKGRPLRSLDDTCQIIRNKHKAKKSTAFEKVA